MSLKARYNGRGSSLVMTWNLVVCVCVCVCACVRVCCFVKGGMCIHESVTEEGKNVE